MLDLNMPIKANLIEKWYEFLMNTLETHTKTKFSCMKVPLKINSPRDIKVRIMMINLLLTKLSFLIAVTKSIFMRLLKGRLNSDKKTSA